MRQNNLSTLLGIVGGFFALTVGFLIEGGSLASLFSVSAIIIIVGGTLAATLTSFTLADIVAIPRMLADAMTMPRDDDVRLIELFTGMAEKARREGLLVLEDDVQTELASPQYDPLIRKGVSLVVDGTDPELVRSILEEEIHGYEERAKREAAVFETAGGYSPTMGIIGTVLGLINVLGRLADTANLGSSIALAFIATLYGIGLANLFWLPVSNKLKLRLKVETYKKELMVAGIMSIQSGENPRIVQEKLVAFVEESKRRAVESIKAEQ